MSEKHRGRRPTRENVTPQSEVGNNRSEQDRAEFKPVVEHLVIAGLTDTEIAKQVGIDRKAVAYLRKQCTPAAIHPVSGQVNKGMENDRVNAEVYRLHLEGLTYVEIAEQLGIGWTSVRSRLRNGFKEYMTEQRDAVAGRQTADLEVMRMELLEIIIRAAEDGDFSVEDFMEEMAEGNYAGLINKVSEKARRTQDAKFKAMEVLLKVMEREAKLFGLDAASQVNVNHNIKVEPEAIELLERLKKRREVDNVIEAEIIDDFDMGNPEG